MSNNSENPARRPPAPQPVIIFADKPFYRQRREPEQAWVGILLMIPGAEGPNTRYLPYRLETEQTTLALYAAGPEEARLRPFIGERVRLMGKLIDLRGEGFGMEVWVGSLVKESR